MLQLLSSQPAIQVVSRAGNCNSRLEMQMAAPFKYQGSLGVGVKIQAQCGGLLSIITNM